MEAIDGVNAHERMVLMVMRAGILVGGVVVVTVWGVVVVVWG